MTGSNAQSRTRLGSLNGASLMVLAMFWAAGPQSAFAQGTAAPQLPGSSSQQQAAQTDAAPSDADDPATDIVVTGSRVSRNGNDAPSPVTVIGAADLAIAARPRLADALNDLPALAGSTTPRTAGVGVGGGTAGTNLLNLRNLGVIRTLTLLDGRRVVPSTTIGAVDVNLLPTGLVRQVDVVTGGASAVYGADAVAGTVNFLLDTTFTGLKAEAQAGTTTRSDGATQSANVSFGTPFASDRGHIVLNASYVNSGEVLYRDRDWARGGYIINNPAATAANGLPRRLLVQGAGLALATPGGLITGGPLRGTQFDANGTPRPFNYGTTAGAYAVSPDAYDPNTQIQLVAPVRQGTVFARGQFDISDGITAFAEFAYGHSDTDQSSASYFRLGNVTIRNDNAFLDGVTRQRLAAAGATSFALGRYNTNLGLAQPRNERELYRYVAGLQGKLSDWKWNLYYNRGLSRIDNIVDGNAIVSRYNQAVDAVVDANGQVVCRSTITNPTNGCQPYNPFGTQTVSDAVRGYLLGQARQHVRLTQDVVAGDFSGSLFRLPGGDLTVAAGAEYRHETGSGDADATSIANDFFVGNYKPFRGEVTVKEAFVEVGVPIFADFALGHRLELNGAARVTDYSTSGTIATWKLGAVYEPVSALRLRVTRSRDIRAPNINDLFLGGLLQTQTVNDPQNGGQTFTILRRTAGNPALRPEIARTLVAGAVLTPSLLRGFSLSVDYYNIKLRDAISSLTQQEIVNLCNAGDQSFCGLVTRTGGIITQVDTLPINFQVLRSSGVDIEGGYRTALGTGELSFRALATYVHRLSLGSGATIISRDGEVGDNGRNGEYGVPRWRGLGSVSYRDGPATVAVTSRFVGASRIESDWTALDIDRNRVPAQVYFDLYGAVKVNTGARTLEIFASAENVLDRDPPLVPSTSSLAFVTPPVNPQVYDTLGRSVRVGARLLF